MVARLDVRNSIIEVASQMFAEKGYSGISMREVAEEVGVSKSALYYHFLDKEQLFLDILLTFLNETQIKLSEIQTQDSGLKSQLVDIIEYFDHETISKKRMIWFLRHDIHQLSEEKSRLLIAEYHRGFFQILEDLFQSAMDREEIKPHDPRTLVSTFLGMVYPFLSPQEGATGTDENWSDHVLEIFWNGVSK